MNATFFPHIPSDTIKAARAVFGRSNFYVAVGNQANELFSGLTLDDPLGWVQKPARTLAMLYLITIFQYVETLPDDLAAEAMRKRLDWKYALHLSLNYPGFEAALFCKFRQWLLVDLSSQQNLQVLLSRLSTLRSLPDKEHLLLESARIIKSVCLLSRLEIVWLAISHTLEALATRQPEWLRSISLPFWYERYGHRREVINLAAESPEQEAIAQAIGSDGYYLLKVIAESGAQELAGLSEISRLKQVWRVHYDWVEGGVSWKKEACSTCSLVAGLKNLPVPSDNGNEEVIME